jgi:enoyl-CoA hydratase
MGVAVLRVGVPFPTAPLEIFRNAVGARAAELVMTGRTVGPEEAYALGMLDAVVEPDALVETALEQAALLARIPRTTFAHTREQFRGETRRKIAASAEADQRTRALWGSDEIRGAVRGYLEQLAAR